APGPDPSACWPSPPNKVRPARATAGPLGCDHSGTPGLRVRELAPLYASRKDGEKQSQERSFSLVLPRFAGDFRNNCMQLPESSLYDGETCTGELPKPCWRRCAA